MERDEKGSDVTGHGEVVDKIISTILDELQRSESRSREIRKERAAVVQTGA